MTEIFIALGTNLGDRVGNLKEGLAALSEKVTLTECSSLYETAPMYVEDQPRFLNMAVKGSTDLSIRTLLVFLKEKEDQLGRVKTIRNGPRLIDFDILYYGAERLDEADLKVPHISIAERSFVLHPLFDLAPNWHDVRQGKTIAEMHAALGDIQDIVRVDQWPPLHFTGH